MAVEFLTDEQAARYGAFHGAPSRAELEPGTVDWKACTFCMMDAAVTQLRADGHEVRDEDVARLSPFVRHHVDMLGRYSFLLPELPGGLRPLRDPERTEVSAEAREGLRAPPPPRRSDRDVLLLDCSAPGALRLQGWAYLPTMLHVPSPSSAVLPRTVHSASSKPRAARR